jgi:hypothetical protein
MGRARYPDATKLLITADAGGSNGYRVRAWKAELAKLAGEVGLDITVSHYPPGTSKWNRIEHRMLSFITINWRGRDLTTYRTIIELIAATTTQTGLRIRAERDTEWYATGLKIPDAEMDVSLAPHSPRLARRLELHPGRNPKRMINHAASPNGRLPVWL